MSRGPTRRVRRLLTEGAVSEELLRAADHEADLLAHPYIGVDHLRIARLHLAGQLAERDDLRRQQRAGLPKRWWRPRSPHSALRRGGLAQTRAARRAAQHRDANNDDPGHG